MVWQQTLVFLTLVISLLQIQQVVCSGVFELRLKSFTNENGKDSMGHCCGGGDRNGRCVAPCRTQFRVCLKHYQNQIDLTSTCTFGDVMTPVLGENNVFLSEHEAHVAGFSNPIRFPFDFSWPGDFSLIVEAWHDATPNSTNDDAGVNSKTTSVNIGGRDLISRFSMQQKLDVKSQWTEKRQELANVKLVFEFRVTCDPHYYGNGCANLCRPRDDNFGHYNCSSEGEIVCLDGWKGDYCTKPRCLSGCDETHGYCNKPGECSCHSGWKGPLCNECERYPGCMHGSCQKPWDCLCDEGWGGLFCNQDLNYCTNHKPCRNGGTCFNTGQGSYTCSCPPGYTGMDCDKKLSDCSHKPCLNGASCKENGTSYQCECLKGWYGNHCEIAMQTCEDRPCQHGGTCMDSIHGYKCSCPAGYSGPQCQHAVDHCSPNPCANKGNCSLAATESGFECKCPVGFSGPRCQTNIDDCHGNPCRNGGSCIDLVNNYRCQCVPGYAGQHCETEVNVCLTKPCANGGTCEPLLNDYQCKCRPSFRGKDCSVHVNECVNQSPCKNGGTCYSGQNGVECECRSGFSGTYCEMESSSNAVSTAIVGNISRHVAVAGAVGGDDKLIGWDWYLIVLVSVAVPTGVLVAYLVLKCSKQRRQREQKKADEEARMQNEQNSVHSSVTKHGDTHMIKNTWGQCPPAKKMDTDNADLCYPKQVSYAAVPTAAAVIDHNLAPAVYTLQRSRSQKQLNIDPPPLHRHTVCNRVVSCKDLDSIVRSTTPAPLDNRLSVLSINISHSNLSDSSLSSKQQQCSQLLDKETSKSVQNNTLNSSSVLNGSSGGLGGNNSVYVIDEHFAQTLFATEV